jgi:hypothetical protein
VWNCCELTGVARLACTRRGPRRLTLAPAWRGMLGWLAMIILVLGAIAHW